MKEDAIARELHMLNADAEARIKEQQRLWQRLPGLVAFWTEERCSSCLREGQPFDHGRQFCPEQAFQGHHTSRMRARLSNRSGKSQCFTCMLPLPLCPRFQDEQGAYSPQPTQQKCSNGYVLWDLLAVLWDLPRARPVWAARIAAETGNDGEDEQGFDKHCKRLTFVRAKGSISQVLIDLVWFTDTYFRDGNRYTELLAAAQLG